MHKVRLWIRFPGSCFRTCRKASMVATPSITHCLRLTQCSLSSEGVTECFWSTCHGGNTCMLPEFRSRQRVLNLKHWFIVIFFKMYIDLISPGHTSNHIQTPWRAGARVADKKPIYPSRTLRTPLSILFESRGYIWKSSYYCGKIGWFVVSFCFLSYWGHPGSDG